MLRKSACTRSTIDVASSRKRTMEQRITYVRDKFAETQEDLEQLFVKMESHLNVNLNPLTHNQQYYLCLSNLDYLLCSLEQLSMYCRTFEASFDSMAEDLNGTQSSLLVGPPPNFPTSPMLHNFMSPNIQPSTPISASPLAERSLDFMSADTILTPTLASASAKTVIPKHVKKKDNDKLIDFSSESSLSLETVSEKVTPQKQGSSPKVKSKPLSQQPTAPLQHKTKSRTNVSMAKKKIDQLEAKVATCKIGEDDWSVIRLPEQQMLEQDKEYQAFVANHESPSRFYVLVEHFDEQRGFVLTRITKAMEEYYSSHRVDVRPLLHDMHFCALRENDEWFRCLILDTQEESNQVEVFYVDYGGRQWHHIDAIQPLVPRFCDLSPIARECHLAHVEPVSGGEWSEEALDTFGVMCSGDVFTMRVEDDSSESLGVILVGTDGLSLNDKLVAQGHAVRVGLVPSLASQSKSLANHTSPVANAAFKDASSTSLLRSCPDVRRDSDPWDISNLPEYENAMEAVTGHAARDEADICKFYKGPPDSTCFKGANCTKKHVVLHPDGWTRDKVQVLKPPPELKPPAPGSRTRVLVANCEDYNHLHVHLIAPNENVPSGLTPLITRMNTPAIRSSLENFKTPPALGEMVMAYFTDNYLYRAQVIELEPDNCRVQVRYVDFGNRCWVRLDHVFYLSPEFLSEPFMAVSAVLAELELKRQSVDAKCGALKVVRQAAGDKVFVANVLAHESIGMVVQLEDREGFSLVQTLVTQHPDLFVFKRTKIA